MVIITENDLPPDEERVYQDSVHLGMEDLPNERILNPLLLYALQWPDPIGRLPLMAASAVSEFCPCVAWKDLAICAVWAIQAQCSAFRIAHAFIATGTTAEHEQYLLSNIGIVCHLCGKIILLKEAASEAECQACVIKRMLRNRKRASVDRAIREKYAAGNHTEAEWKAAVAGFGGRCLRCGSVDRITKDHVIPIASGGSDSIDNLQPLCRSCNSWKNNRIIDYRDHLGEEPEQLYRRNELSGSSA